MITRQDLYSDLFKLKNAGVDITEPIKVMESVKGIPDKVVEFLRDHSPQFQFYKDIQKNQKALMKNILNYESLDRVGRIKVCSSLITRSMISIEYKNLDESLLEDLKVSKLAKALESSLSIGDDTMLNEVLSEHRNAVLVYCKSRNSERNDNSGS